MDSCGAQPLNCCDSGSRNCFLELKPFVHLNPIPLNVSQLHSPNSSVSQHWSGQQQSLNNLSASYSLNGEIHLPPRLNSQGTLVFTIREKRVAASRELYNQRWFTHTGYFYDKTTVVLWGYTAAFNELVCVSVCVLSQSFDLSRCSDIDHRHHHVSSWIWTVYGWRGQNSSILLILWLFSCSFLVVFFKTWYESGDFSLSPQTLKPYLWKCGCLSHDCKLIGLFF